MHEVLCPGCGGLGPYSPRRYHDDGVEHECLNCGHRHTQREDRPGEAFCFFPGSLFATFPDSPDGLLPPLDLGGPGPAPG
jgi:hypothetical protein